MEVLIYLAAIAAMAVVLVAQFRGRLSVKKTSGLLALITAGVAVTAIHDGDRLGATLNAAACAWHAYRWWRGGGDDDTKRRLRAASKAFTPTRHTAPVGEAA